MELLTVSRLPPLKAVLKSRDVEDPINLWFNRPLAYAFVVLVHRTPITPNQITLLSIVVGAMASACWWWGTPQAMLWGGILLWSSAILDGADGLLARARQSFSELGRALDGSADLIVAALMVAAASWHLWVRHQSLAVLGAIVPVALMTALQIHLYDYYKESFLMRTRPDWDGVPERVSDVERRIAELDASGAPFLYRRAMRLYLDLVSGQTRVIALMDPMGSRDHLTFKVSAVSVRDYRRFNLGPLKVWISVSLAPHSYLFAVCGMFDRLDLYLWGRLTLGTALSIVAVVWQRQASRRTRAALEAAGLAPEAAAAG